MTIIRTRPSKEGLNQGSRACRQERLLRGRWTFHSLRPDSHQGYSPPSRKESNAIRFSFRKEVIQPQVLLRLPCYDFTPIMNYTLDGCPLAVGPPASSATHFRDVTGGVYKARERIHRGVLIRDY
jgi:hypothetical protein